MTSPTIPDTMAGVVLTGHGDLDQLVYRTDLPVPRPAPGWVLIAVHASSVNNTDINTRIGWYSKAVTGATEAGGTEGIAHVERRDATWSGRPLAFPRIQGADCYGEIVAVGADVPAQRVGERVLVRTMLRAPVGFASFACWTFGSECDGGFAEYAVAPAADTYRVTSTLPATSLGAIPCAYGTAEGMLSRAAVDDADRVLVIGASGGVGSAAVQLAKLRGAAVTAVASAGKACAVRSLGADAVVPRSNGAVADLAPGSFSVIVDLVGGPQFAALPALLARGGRYVTAGAIAGPMVGFDLRTLYLNDLTFHGCAWQGDAVFADLMSYLAEGRLDPLVAATFSLAEIRSAQELFLSKDFVGKIVLVP